MHDPNRRSIDLEAVSDLLTSASDLMLRAALRFCDDEKLRGMDAASAALKALHAANVRIHDLCLQSEAEISIAAPEGAAVH